MFDVIDFLETLGQNAQLRYASRDQVEFALSGAVVEPAMRVAILARNGPGLQVLGMARACRYCSGRTRSAA